MVTDIFAFDFESKEDQQKYWRSIESFMFQYGFKVTMRRLNSLKLIEPEFTYNPNLNSDLRKACRPVK